MLEDPASKITRVRGVLTCALGDITRVLDREFLHVGGSVDDVLAAFAADRGHAEDSGWGAGQHDDVGRIPDRRPVRERKAGGGFPRSGSGHPGPGGRTGAGGGDT